MTLSQSRLPELPDVPLGEIPAAAVEEDEG